MARPGHLQSQRPAVADAVLGRTRCRRADADTARHHGRTWIVRHRVLVDGEVRRTERGVGIVLPSHAIVHLSDKSLDITAMVLQRLDVRLPQVTVQIPK